MPELIAIVDDELIYREMVSTFVERIGHEARVYSTYEDMHNDILNGYSPKILIMDTEIGVHKGYEWADRINSDSRFDIIGMSGRDYLTEWKSRGYCFLNKPFRKSELEICINHLLEGKPHP